MADPLAQSMGELRIDTNDDEFIDSILDLAPPHKKSKHDPEELTQELEMKYLTPSTTFSEAWLNKLQQ